jgi:hypothetical protein
MLDEALLEYILAAKLCSHWRIGSVAWVWVWKTSVCCDCVWYASYGLIIVFVEFFPSMSQPARVDKDDVNDEPGGQTMMDGYFQANC